MKKVEKSIDLGGRTLTLATGHVAFQASGAVMATYGETVVLATVVSQPMSVDLGYFPLSVEYQERLYAGGRIKGSRWVKREGRPTDEEILSGRLIDRSIRPLFPKEYFGKDVQVVITVLSVDMENSPEVVATIAASAAVAISPIPWIGPIGIVKVGLKDDVFITNPTEKDLPTSELDLLVSGTKDAIVMIEAGAKEVTEEKILKALTYAQKETSHVIDLINDLVKAVKPQKETLKEEKITSGLQKKVKELSLEKIKGLISEMASKEVGYGQLDEVKHAVAASLGDEDKAEGSKYFEKLFREEVRKMILSGKRPDGRKFDEIRELSAEVGVLPRTHGSAIFKRGQTQALTITTLGARSLEQYLESAMGEETKRYIHHYSMPPFSTGETGRMGSPSRREIGHGALAERALLPVIPPDEVFPYTIRVVTEILSSNGSTSMASVCGSTLSLMDAGVPITSPVSGIAMGLVVESESKFTILTDIVGLEDGNGDMDFKVAGSKDGVTSLQLDVKTLNLTSSILEKALEQAKKARLKILEVMNGAIKAPRDSVSKHAPKIKVVQINPEKIGELIGPGGKTIRRIIAETGAQIDVDEDGKVHISGIQEEQLNGAVSQVEALTKVPKPGEIYEGIVKRLQPFGAFVEILPNRDGLVHVSDMSNDYVKDPGDIVNIGDKVQVRVKEIDDMGRLNLSMMLDPLFDAQKEERRKERDNNKGRHFEKRTPFERRGSGGPHFPRSRYVSENKRKY
ncbi:polyribonucleotide nucleotidyltransferase [Candidatus Woesebacteria bacterium RIFCSPLOWO2_01_FULL_39_10]|uniref:Polyribonucleotide nucleotidyltransferase n=1 Tax=Candidatus Woesebacteria bacterium RIFCSPLOWO2_01_FULL_39_10 TaxID=1802516 RepID=A0A1F8BA82_9BACT|nr:MAG: polyribonucleotide nucleotidyltransferase [Candidatus Woesebacteria bacterium RIFCSPLOWO2_01_FULL_39_10]